MVKSGGSGTADVGDAGDAGSREDPGEEEMAICSRSLAWKIPWTEEPGRF